MIGVAATYVSNYSLRSFMLMPFTLVAKACYTPMGDTGIPPKQILEQVIEGIPLFMGNKYTERNRYICSFIFA